MWQIEEWQIEAMRQAWNDRKLGDTVESLASKLGFSATTFRKYVPSSRVRNRVHVERHKDSPTWSIFWLTQD